MCDVKSTKYILLSDPDPSVLMKILFLCHSLGFSADSVKF